MPDPPRAPTAELFEQMLMHRRALLAYAAGRIGNRRAKLGDPSDFVNDAILRASDPEDERYWGEGKDPNLKRYLLSVVRSLIWNTKQRLRREVPYDEETHADLLVDTSASALAQLIAHEDMTELFAELRAHAKNPLDQKLMELSQEWVFDVEDQMERTGASREDVLAARKRLRYHVATLFRAQGKKVPGEEDE